MNARIRILLGTFLVLLAAVAAVHWWPRPQAPELRLAGWGPDRKTERAEDDAPVDRIALAVGGDSAVLARGPDGWTLSPPDGAVADRNKVRQILEGLREDLVSVLGTPVGGDEAAFGLDPAHRVRVTLKRGDTVVTDLEIGAVGKPEGGVGPGDTFVRVPGTDRAWRVADRDLRRPFDDGVRGLRDRRVLSLEASRIVAMTVTHPAAANPPDRRIVLASDAPSAAPPDDGTERPAAAAAPRSWRIAFPEGYAAGEVDRLATALTTLWAQEWRDAPPEGVDLGPDAYAVQATLDDGTTRTVRVSEVRDDAAWVAVDGVPGFAKVTRHAAESLRKRLGDLRDRSLVGWTADRIAEIALDDGTNAWHFARRDNAFVSLRPAGMVPGRGALESLVNDVARLKADRLVPAGEAPDAETGLASPSARLVVTATDGGRRVLLLGRADGGKAWVRVEGADEAASLAPWMLEKIRRPARTFRNRTVFPFEAGDIARIRIAHPDETLTLTATADAPAGDADAAGTATEAPAALAAPAFAIEGADGTPRAEPVAALVSTLAGLSARDFPDNAPPRLGLPDLKVVVTLRDGTQHAMQVAGQDGDGNPYGLASGAPGFGSSVFTLNPHQVAKLRVRKADLLP